MLKLFCCFCTPDVRLYTLFLITYFSHKKVQICLEDTMNRRQSEVHGVGQRFLGLLNWFLLFIDAQSVIETSHQCIRTPSCPGDKGQVIILHSILMIVSHLRGISIQIPGQDYNSLQLVLQAVVL